MYTYYREAFVKFSKKNPGEQFVKMLLCLNFTFRIISVVGSTVEGYIKMSKGMSKDRNKKINKLLKKYQIKVNKQMG